MSDILEELQTVPVHVTNAHELGAPDRRPRDIQVITQTFVLKTGIRAGGNDSLIQRILDRDLQRGRTVILASANVYLCHTSAQAEAATADSSNAVGAPQDGFIATNVAPVVTYTTDPLWAAVSSDKAAAGVMVSVLIERLRE
jgi:hypothetical protein